MASRNWHTFNGATLPAQPIQSDTPFQFTCPAKTDIWRPSPSDSVFSAPILYQKIPASKFHRLTATVFAPWRTQYDQAGIILAFPGKAGGHATTAAGSEEEEKVDPPKWIKAGIEYFSSAPVIGVVGCDRLADWSLCPMRSDLHQKVTVAIERTESTVWVYAKQEGDEGELKPLREIKWAFGEDDDGEAEIWAGVYIAKPTPEAEDEEKRLEVTFEGVQIEADE